MVKHGRGTTRKPFGNSTARSHLDFNRNENSNLSSQHWTLILRFGQFIQFDYGQATFGMPDHVKTLICIWQILKSGLVAIFDQRCGVQFFHGLVLLGQEHKQWIPGSATTFGASLALKSVAKLSPLEFRAMKAHLADVGAQLCPSALLPGGFWSSFPGRCPSMPFTDDSPQGGQKKTSSCMRDWAGGLLNNMYWI